MVECAGDVGTGDTGGDRCIVVICIFDGGEEGTVDYVEGVEKGYTIGEIDVGWKELESA